MKEISLTIAVLLVSFSTIAAQPQLEKGNLLLGGTSTVALSGSISSELMSLGFIKIKYKYGSDPAEDAYKLTSYNFLPKAGYFVIDNLVAGLQAVVSGYTEKDLEYDETYKQTTIGIGPFVRYYYPLDKFYPFAEAEFLFGTVREAWYGDDEKTPFSMVGILVGAALPLGENVTFDAAAGYLRSSMKNTDPETEDKVFFITSGFSLRMGFTIYL
ncbi:MAG: hypothetical protein AB9888_07785 [Bacteroidales bacterium]